MQSRCHQDLAFHFNFKNIKEECWDNQPFVVSSRLEAPRRSLPVRSSPFPVRPMWRYKRSRFRWVTRVFVVVEIAINLCLQAQGEGLDSNTSTSHGGFNNSYGYKETLTTTGWFKEHFKARAFTVYEGFFKSSPVQIVELEKGRLERRVKCHKTDQLKEMK